MSREHERDQKQVQKVVVSPDGPYIVHGSLPLVRKAQVVSEYGEPLTWQTGETLCTTESYDLCRCGQSRFKPLCDVTHALIDWDGTETADPRPTSERQVTLPGGTGIVVRRDYSLCTESGYCRNRRTGIDEMLEHTDDTEVRSLVMAMSERCPSGSYTYSLSECSPDIEPDLPKQVAVTTEITSDGPIAGPLWVTGNIPVERADGEPFETRNRVTLCCCGRSKNKPLCDGTHRELEGQE